jgi:hypothetical protein
MQTLLLTATGNTSDEKLLCIARTVPAVKAHVMAICRGKFVHPIRSQDVPILRVQETAGKDSLDNLVQQFRAAYLHTRDAIRPTVDPEIKILRWTLLIE